MEVQFLKNFTYIAKDYNGKKIKGTFQAEGSQELVNHIVDKGLFLVSYSEGISLKNENKVHKLKTKELSITCRQLSSMMTSGLTLMKSLDILYKQQENKVSRACWQAIYEDVQKGQSFSDALKAQSGVFPDFFVSMVNAGEASGTLDTVMNRMSEHYAKENKLKNKVRGALIYPIILLSVSLIVVIGLFTLIMPKFKEMLGDKNLPTITKVMFGFSEFITSKWYIVLIIVAAIIFGVIYCFRDHEIRKKIDRHIIKSRMIGKLVTKVYTGRFARSLSSLYSSGIPMVEAIERSSAILGNTYIAEQFVQVVDDVKQGGSLSNAIQKTEVFEPMFCSMIFVGEESGTLDDILAKTADFYEEESDSAIGRLVSMIDPILIIFLGIIIGIVVLSIYPAMQNVGDAVS